MDGVLLLVVAAAGFLNAVMNLLLDRRVLLLRQRVSALEAVVAQAAELIEAEVVLAAARED